MVTGTVPAWQLSRLGYKRRRCFAVLMPILAYGACCRTATEPRVVQSPHYSPHYWHGVERMLPLSPYGNEVAISCHNCYGGSLGETTNRVALALDRGADLIELDLTLHTDNHVYVEHEHSNYGTRPLLVDVLDYAPLLHSNRILFLEIKEEFCDVPGSEVLMAQVLRLLRDREYIRSGRPAVLGSFFGNRRHLGTAMALLARSEFAGIRDHVRFHVLFGTGAGDDIATQQTQILELHDAGFDAIQVDCRQRNLFGALMLAKQLGMGAGVFTTPTDKGVLISALREDVHFITTDFRPDLARQYVQDDTGLLYLNTAFQDGYPVRYFRNTPAEFSIPKRPGQPGFELLPVGSGNDRVGGSLVFRGSEALTTYDADNDASSGYLVTAVVNFDGTSLPPGHTRSIVAKSDGGGFALEMRGVKVLFFSYTVLRFGVYIGGGYKYAYYPMSQVNNTDSYFIIGAYDGEGPVWLWVNNDEGTPAGPCKGGVVRNNSPVVVGADPQGAINRRFYFRGKVQQVVVQSWRNH
jgi:hypothetical protein